MDKVQAPNHLVEILLTEFCCSVSSSLAKMSISVDVMVHSLAMMDWHPASRYPSSYHSRYPSRYPRRPDLDAIRSNRSALLWPRTRHCVPAPPPTPSAMAFAWSPRRPPTPTPGTVNFELTALIRLISNIQSGDLCRSEICM